jgi:hypothetical protein
MAEQPTETVEEQGLQVGDEVYLILGLRWLKTLSSAESQAKNLA